MINDVVTQKESPGIIQIPEGKSTLRQLYEIGSGKTETEEEYYKRRHVQVFVNMLKRKGLYDYPQDNQKLLKGYVSYEEPKEELTENLDKKGEIFYTDNKGEIVNNKDFNLFQKTARKIQAFGTNLKNAIEETDADSEMYKEKTEALAGFGLFPLGSSAAAPLAKAATPLLGRKIAQTTAQNFTGGALSGAAAGYLHGKLHNEDPYRDALQSLLVFALTSGTAGYLGSKVEQSIALKRAASSSDTGILNKYYSDYIEGLNNKTKPIADFRAQKLGIKSNNKNSGIAFDKPNKNFNLTKEDEEFIKRAEQLATKLRKPKPIDPILKKEGQIVIMKGSEPFEKGEIDYVITEITSNMSKNERIKGYAVREINGYWFRLNYNKNGKHTMGKFKTDERIYYGNR